MKLLDFHREALRRATDERLELHMRRLDRIVLQYGRGPDGYGYGGSRLDVAEEQRAAERRRRWRLR